MHLQGERDTINGTDANIVSYRTARKICTKRNAEGFLYFVRKFQQPIPADLPKDIPKRFQALIERFSDCFRSELPELPPERVFQHSIDTGDAKPVNHNAYPLSYI